MSSVTVAIPVLDGGALLAEALDAVRAQIVDRELEVIVCDSGSQDGSPALARDRGAQVVEIPRGTFSHGGTRNLLVERSSGEHVAFLTQDSVPAHDRWLQRLLDGFGHAEDVALTFGPYLPRADASPMTRRELTEWFATFSPDGAPRVDRLDELERDVPPHALLGRRAFFTDANGCVARAAWEQAPFRAAPYAEDHLLALDMLRAGFAKVYVPDAAVVHSHDYPPLVYLRRCFDEWRGLREVYGHVAAGRPWWLAAEVRRQIARDRAAGMPARSVPRAAAHHGARALGAAAGSRADRLPVAVRRRLSLEGRGSFEPATIHRP